MADIEVIIKIPEEEYNIIKNSKMPMTWAEHLIKKGAPLPKGHGRLIDADELEECKEIMTTISGESKYAVRMDDIRNMLTIIEADKESEDKR